MVFDNEAKRAVEFFEELVFKHYAACVDTSKDEIAFANRGTAKKSFTDSRAFQEFVRAAEGVPRDAINILSLSAQKASARPIAIADVRSAANLGINATRRRLFRPILSN